MTILFRVSSLLQEHTLSDRADSTQVESPLPGGVAELVRFLFEVPQWVQTIGAVIGVISFVALAILVWKRRESVITWITTRSDKTKWAIAVVTGFVVITAGTTGAVSWNYMQHDNDFCTGCHVMGEAYQRFTASEHDTLNCHDCHQQSIFASTRQLYLWVLERPEHIGDHAPVANEICESCHVTGEPEIWQRVAATAGHRTHLESDSTVLEGLMCVTCHGVEVHRFSPADSTCSQADCHADNDITLGEMENQTTLHCVTCHEFTADVPLLAERDSAQSTLTPAREECLGCHEMQEVLADFDAERDPHNGTCGSCHNPHAQTEAIGAAESCATSECHADWETEPFHVGRDHGEAGERCVLCHEPHRASIDASNCESCHLRILEEEDISPGVRRRLERSLPFDTTRVLRGVSSRIEPREMPPSFVGEPWSILQHWGAGFGLPKVSPYDDPLRDFPEPRASPPDTFPHDRHEDLSCLNCHVTRSGHGQLTFEAPRGCQICHHESPEREPCADCHQASELLTAQTVSVSVHTQSYAPREREVGFSHEAHTTEDCSSCHVESVSLAAGPEQASCNDCHGDHHQPARECSTCHLGDGFLEPHAPPADAHLECASCHVLGEDAVLRPDRQLCVTCHVDEREHYVEKECTVCHMGAPPEILQNGLLKRGDTP